MKNPRFKAKLACEMAGVDRQQFNEACSRGFYKCAPETNSGSTRLFGVPDLLALMVFGRLLRTGLSAKDAGALSCEVSRCLNDYVTESTYVDPPEGWHEALSKKPYLVLSFGELGPVRAFVADDMGGAFKRQVEGVSVRQIMVFDLAALVKTITQWVEHMQSNPVFGSDE